MTMGVSLSRTTAGKFFQTASFDLDTPNSIHIRLSAGNQSPCTQQLALQHQSPCSCANKVESFATQSYWTSHFCLFLGFFAAKKERLDWMVSKVPSSLGIKFQPSVGWMDTWCPSRQCTYTFAKTSSTPNLHFQYQNDKLKSPREQCFEVKMLISKERQCWNRPF